MTTSILLHHRPIGTSVGTVDGIARFDGHREMAAVLALEGEIDEAVLADLQTQLQDAIESRPRRLVLDLSAVEFLSVAATVELADAQRRAEASGLDVFLVVGPRCVQRALAATRLNDRFDVAPSLRFALAGGDVDLGYSVAAV